MICNVALVLGDNVFYGQHFTEKLNALPAEIRGLLFLGIMLKILNALGLLSLIVRACFKHRGKAERVPNLTMQ